MARANRKGNPQSAARLFKCERRALKSPTVLGDSSYEGREREELFRRRRQCAALPALSFPSLLNAVSELKGPERFGTRCRHASLRFPWVNVRTTRRRRNEGADG